MHFLHLPGQRDDEGAMHGREASEETAAANSIVHPGGNTPAMHVRTPQEAAAASNTRDANSSTVEDNNIQSKCAGMSSGYNIVFRVSKDSKFKL